jgi:kinetochore protein Nuf2
MRLYQRSRQFLESIQFQGFTLRDLLRPTPRRVVHVLSALINYLHFRQEKIALLQPVVDEFPDSDERRTELKARIAEVCADPCSVYALCSGKCLCEYALVPVRGIRPPLMQHQKAIADHELKEQMEEPVVQQIQLEVNALKQKIQEYNKQQMALRARAKSIDEEKDGIASKVLIPNSYHTLL